jgi:hypothetical protein
MSSSAYWLFNKIKDKNTCRFLNENCLEIDLDGNKIIVFCPTSDEYEITTAIVQKAKNMNATLLAYPHQWCKATSSAISYSKSVGIDIMPFGKFLSIYGTEI